jgi:hypothetical protein
MVKETKNIDFITTGRQPSEQDFARISEWIKRDKQKRTVRHTTKLSTGKKHLPEQRQSK